MPQTKKYSDEAIMEAMEEHGSMRAAARAVGCSFATLQERVTKLRRRGWSPEHDMTKVVPEGYRLKGTSTLYGEDGKPKLQWVKSTIDHERQEELAREIARSMAREIEPRAPVTLEGMPNANLMTIYPIVDAHIGMMAWGKEVGADYDLAIARERTIRAFEYLVECSQPSGTCVIANLGDFFHSENMEGMTSRSKNVLDMDSRFGKMIDVGVEVIIAMIDAALRKHKTVHVVNLRGNHDETASQVMNSCMVAMYRENERVLVDPSPSVFKYQRFGNVLVGMHHGHATKMDGLPMVMASDRAKDWGDTEHRFWLTGHVHHRSKMATEKAGCSVESFRTLIPADSHAHDHGYRSMSQAVAIVYHREYGEVTRHYANAAIIAASV